MTGWHTALLETYGRSRMDRDHFCLASRRAPGHCGRRGKPRLTFVSDGNPLPRWLLGSKKNSLLTAVSTSDGLPVTSEGEAVHMILAEDMPG